MTWQYNVADLATSPRDQVRLEIGDTNPLNPLLQDEEIALALTQRSTIFGAASNLCSKLSTRFAIQCDSTAGDTKFSYGQLSKAFMLRALWYDVQAARAGSGAPIVGGISKADVENSELDEDRVPPQFNRNQFDSDLPVGQSVPNGPDPDQQHS